MVAQGLGVPEQLPTLAAAVGASGAMDKLVAVEVGALAETLATGVAGEGRPAPGCWEHWGPVLRPSWGGRWTLASRSASTGGLLTTTSPIISQILTRSLMSLLLTSCSE